MHTRRAVIIAAPYYHTISFDALRMVARRHPGVAGRTDTTPVDTNGSALAVVEFCTAMLVQLPYVDHTQTRTRTNKNF